MLRAEVLPEVRHQIEPRVALAAGSGPRPVLRLNIRDLRATSTSVTTTATATTTSTPPPPSSPRRPASPTPATVPPPKRARSRSPSPPPPEEVAAVPAPGHEVINISDDEEDVPAQERQDVAPAPLVDLTEEHESEEEEEDEEEEDYAAEDVLGNEEEGFEFDRIREDDRIRLAYAVRRVSNHQVIEDIPRVQGEAGLTHVRNHLGEILNLMKSRISAAEKQRIADILAVSVDFKLWRLPVALIEQFTYGSLSPFRGCFIKTPPHETPQLSPNAEQAFFIPSGDPITLNNNRLSLPEFPFRPNSTNIHIRLNDLNTPLPPVPDQPLFSLSPEWTMYTKPGVFRVKLCRRTDFELYLQADPTLQEVDESEYWEGPSGPFPNPLVKGPPTIDDIRDAGNLLPKFTLGKRHCAFCGERLPRYKKDKAAHYLQVHSFPLQRKVPSEFVRPIILPATGYTLRFAYKRVSIPCLVRLTNCKGWVALSKIARHPCYRLLALFDIPLHSIYSSIPALRHWWQNIPRPLSSYKPPSEEVCSQDNRFRALRLLKTIPT